MAVAHKLLEVCYSLIKRGDYYRDPHIDYEKLVVDKKASRWIKSLKEYGYIE
jgi:hypothetical protein